MKILTVITAWPDDFDHQVNEALEKGYILGRRDLVTVEGGHTRYYAELVQLDPVPEPDGAEAIQALHTVRAACLAHQGPCDDCPLTDWCEQLAHGGDPTDWDLEVLE